MKPGDLITPIIDYSSSPLDGVEITPFTPKREVDICTVKQLVPTPEGPALLIEEIQIKHNGEIAGFHPEHWRVVEADSIPNEIKEVLENSDLVLS